MKIAILGTRGIPNNYGGFEQFAEYISEGLVLRGHDVTVYNPHFHPYNESGYKGVKLIKKYSPESLLGAAANFLYDYLCFKDALKKEFDIILECGYHSNAPSYYLKGKRHKSVLITNMDGIEWKRSKWSPITRQLIRSLEKLAVAKSDILVSDNIGIQEYYKSEFNADSYFIAYGANLVTDYDETLLLKYKLEKKLYYCLIARIEPENNIELILDGYVKSKSNLPFIVIGGKNNQFAKYLIAKYQNENIHFIGGVYDIQDLNAMRKFAAAYFHGHSVGGTNPSLLEAMASDSNIVSHNNEFNKSVLGNGALYFTNSDDVKSIISNELYIENSDYRIRQNRKNIENKYSWDIIIDQYESLFYKSIKKDKL